MPDINSLADRIDAKFTAVAEKYRQYQVEQLQEHKERQKRLEQLVKVFDQLRDIWRPRLELLVKKFGDHVKVTPEIVPSRREATFAFKSRLAAVSLRFWATTDRDIQKVLLCYDLRIIPILMQYTPHAELEFPLDAVDPDAVAKWLDDRILDFVQTYVSLGENDFYLKEHMVEDPIAHVSFPSMAAGATLEWGGEKFYFLGEETRREFAKQHDIAV